MLETSYLVMETHANSTLSKCMLLACAYQSAKENGHCQNKILPRLLKTIWQRKDVWKTLLQNKSSGTINPAYLPLELWNNTKNVSINKTLSITTLAQYFYPATLEEHRINNYDPDRVLFGKRALQRNASMFILWTWGKMSLKGIFFSNFGNLYMLQNNLLLNRGLLTGKVLAKLPDPNGFGLGFSSTLQGARLESLMRERSWLTTRQKESKRDCNRPTAVRIMK